MLLKNKRGLEKKYIVEAIIVIVTAAILFIFLGNLNAEETIDKEVCHESVILKSTFNIGPIETGKSAPLKCKTEKICLSMGGECPANYEKVEVEDEDDIKRQLANSMADCWWMLGKGKLNFMEQGLLQKDYCIMCSKIAFDTKIKEKFPEIKDFDKFLISEKISGEDITYLEYFTPGVSPQYLENLLEEDIKDESGNKIGLTKSIFTNYDYTPIFVLGVRGKLKQHAGLVVSYGLGLAAVVLAPVTFGGSLVIFGGVAVAGSSVVLFATTEAEHDAYLYLKSFDAESLKNLKCSEFSGYT